MLKNEQKDTLRSLRNLDDSLSGALNNSEDEDEDEDEGDS